MLLFIHNIINIAQWLGFVGGAILAPILVFTGQLIPGMLSLCIAYLALLNLKMEMIAFARPR